MSAKNAMMLIIKQNPGIEYNALLNRIAPSYRNLNSARAALSRSLKDLRAFGLVSKEGDKLFITEKAAAEISSEMKSKLLIKLNDLLKAENPYKNIDEIVPLLHALIERSKSDESLLKVARRSANFSLADLRRINEQLAERCKHLERLANVFSEQTASLKEMDFTDECLMPFDNKTLALVVSASTGLGGDRVDVETGHAALLAELASLAGQKPKGSTVSLPPQELPKAFALLSRLSEQGDSPVLEVLLPSVEVKVSTRAVSLIGPSSKVNALVNTP